uniref:Uncharacterized protein n=1 Tax=Fagus sylvatica TaxID=28930 RepID=A0A2N9ENT6_FAGSY
MENPKAEAEAEQNPSPKLDSKESGHAPNGDGKWTSFVMGSESQKDQDQDQSQSEVSGNRTPSTGSRKSVHWSPELVTESSASNMHSPHGSNNNPYFSPSPVPTFLVFTDFPLKIRWTVYVVFLGDGGRRLEKLLRRLKISLETRGSTVS